MAATTIDIGTSPDGPQTLALKRANRHGLIAGATGTGKTVTLQLLAEEFAREGVNVFAADVKGDLSGIATPGDPTPAWAAERAQEMGITLTPEAQPAVFWDVYGELGLPVRTTITEMGPVLMSRVLEATDAQEGALTVAFKLADDWFKQQKPEGLLLNLADLRALLNYMSENADMIGKKYGLVTPQTISALQRRLLQLEMDGAERLYGEKVLALEDLMRTRPDGKGTLNILAAERLVQSPRLYSAFLLWLMSELWEELPEVGDLDKPKLVFFFDEAHLLFRDASKELVQRVEQVVRLIRSKGVGIYFVTQSPTDIPDLVLSQLGNRIQHALRAYTPQDQKAVRAAAASFRSNPGVDVSKEIQELAVGEALVSTLDEKGAPTPVARTKIRPPNSQVGTLLLAKRKEMIAASDLRAAYETAIDRESAHEILTGRAQASAQAVAEAEAQAAQAKADAEAAAAQAKAAKKVAKAAPKAPTPPPPPRAAPVSPTERMATRVATGMFETLTKEVMRGILGTPRRRR
ncbi:MAG: helicase HerA-like domain-containing protein [Alphaproteobacteria bacterium]